ncbi:nucleotidyltransferase-like protein [Marinicrinis sediminis]|uniref:Nucleotidyltransferase-like protein n=1 Tax=Marinicrinis sediminis TaxID=1652465 RepID=A0ABW5RD42_9BACL
MASIIKKDQVWLEKFGNDARVVTVFSIANENEFSPLTDGFNQMLLVVTDEKQSCNYHTHYIREGRRVQERWIHLEGLRSWILNGQNRYIINWIVSGEILYDKNRYGLELRQELKRFPDYLRNQKLFIEFSFFLRKYLQGKDFLKQKQVFDAHMSLLEALNHWARISIIETGKHPELTVWEQIETINPGIFKLYEELTTNQETIEKRVELVLLACEFSVMTKMKESCKVLLDVIASRKSGWTAIELKEHEDLRELHVEFSLVLNKLVNRSILKEESRQNEYGELIIAYRLA